MGTVQLTEDQSSYVFKTTDFAGANFTSVQITSLPTSGTLYLSGVPVTLNQIIHSPDVVAGNFTFVPNTDVTGTSSFNDVVGTFSSTGTLIHTDSSTILSISPDAGPSALASSIQATENRSYTFKVSDFGYSDSADKTADPLGSVTITSVPSDGTLQLNGTAIAAGQVVTASQISAGQLTFVPNTNSTTGGSFNFKVTDSVGGTTSSSAAAMNISIVGNSPSDPGAPPQASSVTGTEDQTYTFVSTDFKFTDTFDSGGDTLKSITVTSLPTTGTLQLTGFGTVQLGQTVLMTDISAGKLSFVPNSDVTSGSFQFKVTDTTGGVLSSTSATMNVTLHAAGGPTAVASSVTTPENQTYTFTVANIGFSDTGDVNGADSLGSVIITSTPTNGTLFDGSTALTVGSSVSATDISNKLFTYVPNNNATGTDTFNFEVTDKLGGTTSSNAAATRRSTAKAVAGRRRSGSSACPTLPRDPWSPRAGRLARRRLAGPRASRRRAPARLSSRRPTDFPTRRATSTPKPTRWSRTGTAPPLGYQSGRRVSVSSRGPSWRAMRAQARVRASSSSCRRWLRSE
jgi:hypothetical protein